MSSLDALIGDPLDVAQNYVNAINSRDWLMTRRALVILAAFALLSCASAEASDRWAPYIGKWEYRQVNPRSLTGYDMEGERLELVRSGSSVVGRYFGLERMGEEGLYYTATAVTKLTLRDSVLSFVIPARSLYTKRPASLQDAKKMKETGITRHQLTMTGRLVDGHLRLGCTSEPGECPENLMVFGKVVKR